MPDLTVVVSGTTTAIGKTWVTARVVEELRTQGVAVSAHKPVQSFDRGERCTDADILGNATGTEPRAVCPSHRWYPRAMAPPMAAAALGLPPFSVADIMMELRLPPRGIAVIEGVGGPRSPLADDGDTVALAEAVDSDLVMVVADAELGTINSVLLSAAAFTPRHVVVALNRFSADNPLHTRNLAWLRVQAGLEVLTHPKQVASLLVSTLATERV